MINSACNRRDRMTCVEAFERDSTEQYHEGKQHCCKVTTVLEEGNLFRILVG